MGKDKRHVHSNIRKSVHRELLMKEGKLFPLEKTHTPKNAYKRKKFRVTDLPQD